MKISIRAKLFFYMVATVLIFTVVLLGFNLIFTRSFYIRHKKTILLENSGIIEELLTDSAQNNLSSVEFAINRLERREGASVFIGNPNGELFYPTRPFPDGTPDRSPFLPFETQAGSDSTSSFTIVNDPNMDFETLRFQAKTENGMNILIWLPMDEISESINSFNMTVVFATAIVLICSVFWSLFISEKFTKPIKQMSMITKKISEQDFSEMIEVKGYDEIALLSESINELSFKLSSAITQLSEKNSRLEEEVIYEKQLDKMRKLFVAGVSHELKTPMFLIQGYAEGLKKVGHKEDKREYYCNVIMNETEKMDKLIKDLLDLAQIESGMFTVKTRLFDIVTLAREALQKFKPLFDQKGVDVTVNFPESLPVNADPTRTEQIISNFLNNAIDHLDDKVVSVENQPGRDERRECGGALSAPDGADLKRNNYKNEIRVSITQEADKAKISVFNTGENIAEHVIDKIWDSFYKADESRTRQYGGTGLGLSIVRAIQEGHGGGCGVVNKENGVEFWATFSSAV